ncbi:MAG: hypothetical protein ACNA8W_20895, partial [Bradymonadaceae bacterium]
LVQSGPIASCLSYGPKTRHLIAGLWDGSLRCVSVAETIRVKDIRVLKKPAQAAAINVSEHRAAMVDGQTLAILDPVEGVVLTTMELRIPLRSLVFTPGNRLLGLAYEETSLQLWDVMHDALK